MGESAFLSIDILDRLGWEPSWCGDVRGTLEFVESVEGVRIVVVGWQTERLTLEGTMEELIRG